MQVVAGMDSSENFKYMGIIIGSTNAIKQLYQKLKEKYQKLHMRDLYASKRKNLAREFKKEAQILGVEVLRIKVDLNKVVREAWIESKHKKSRRSKRAVYRLAMKELELLLLNLFLSKKVDIVYIDKELQGFKFKGLRIIIGGEASELADIAAHKITKIEEINLSEYLLEALLKKL